MRRYRRCGMYDRPLKKKRKRTSRPKHACSAHAEAHANSGPPTTKIEFDDVADLAEVTRDEEHVSAMFVESRFNYLKYTAYADYPQGRVFMSASEKHPDEERYHMDRIIKRVIREWKQCGVTVYQGSVKAER